MNCFLVTAVSNGVRITTGFDSLGLAQRAKKRALACGATLAVIEATVIGL